MKEWIKSNWYWLLVLPVAAYVIYVYTKAEKDVKAQMAKVRQAKEEKAILKTLENTPVNEN